MTKEKRLAATKETKEQKDLLTEVWKRRIVSEKGYSETIAERIAEKVKSLANYMQYGHAYHCVLQTERQLSTGYRNSHFLQPRLSPLL